MKLSAHQIITIMEDMSRLTDSDIIALLHEELDLDLILPAIYTRIQVENTGLQNVSGEMVNRIFRNFPKLLAWMCVNKEDKLKDYLKMITSYIDIHKLLSLEYTASEKMNTHIRNMIASFYSQVPEARPFVYMPSSELEEVYINKLFGELAVTPFITDSPAGVIKYTYRKYMTPNEFLSEFEKFRKAPLIMLKPPDILTFNNDIYPSANDTARVLLFNIKVCVPTDILNGVVPSNYIKRMHSCETLIEVRLNPKTKEYVVVCGVRTIPGYSPYTKSTVKKAIESHLSKCIKDWLEREVMSHLRREASATSTAELKVYSMGEERQDFEVFHYPATIIENIKWR